MSKPSRPSEPEQARGGQRTFFVTTRTANGRAILQTERMASLFIQVLRTYVRAGEFTIHDFVVMPDHVHILLTVPPEASLERAVQLFKGNFSFRAKRELGFTGEVWQRGFSDIRVLDERSFEHHRRYIANNPVKRGLASSPEEFPFGSVHLKMMKQRAREAADAGAVGESSHRG